MGNPFAKPLTFGAPIDAIPNDSGHGIHAKTLNTDNHNPGTNTILPVGNTSELHQSTAPDYAGTYRLVVENLGGLTPNTEFSSIRTGGALDMRTPWDIGGVAAHTKMTVLEGPVDGNGTEFTYQQDRLPTFNPQTAGPVRGSGGTDYSIALVQAEFAARATQYSQQAIANALISAV